ncbi:SpoIIE family protein phosphatase [Occallatibacter savannae]|uniref:SpoIIE family protein phosphatase n=1 Tax=Occallatibacter savannae TaxID=1002691 RepID=UPI000D69967A|nr:SpoIIE family protein phosphatase [Occallatibacter savannae]
MEIVFSEGVAIKDASSVGEVRRAAAAAGAKLKLDETRAGELAILTTEVARNVLIHGGGGQVIVSGIASQGGPVARILALDTGGGIANLAEAMKDGFSTAGTMGAGLGAMKRMAKRFEVFTGRGGTMVLLEVGEGSVTEHLTFAGVTLPYPGERVCGDGWYCEHTPARTVAVLADGLGHGLGAAEAAQEAVETVRQRISKSPGEILSYMHDALKKTRGAVAAVVEVCPKEGKLTYAGIGNIAASVVSKGLSRSLVSHNGTLGVTMSRVQEFHTEWKPDSVFVMHSDGLQSKWDLLAYPGLLLKHPALICGALIRDFRRQRDDAGVVVLKAA